MGEQGVQKKPEKVKMDKLTNETGRTNRVHMVVELKHKE